MTGLQSILVLTPDLLTAVRIEGGVQRAGCRLLAVESEEAFRHELQMARPILAIIDLGHKWLDLFGIIEGCRKERVTVLAFGPHTDMTRHKDARTAGAQFVYPRSRFMGDTDGCLRKALAVARVP